MRLRIKRISEKLNIWSLWFTLTNLGVLLFNNLMELDQAPSYITIAFNCVYCLALFVVAVPEGLWLIESVATSYAVKKLYTNGSLV